MVSIVCVDVFIAAPGPGQPATCQVLEESGTTWFLLTVVQCSAGPELSGKMVLRFLKICCSCPARWWRWLASVRAEGCWRTVVETALPLPGYHRPQITESNLYPTLHTPHHVHSHHPHCTTTTEHFHPPTISYTSVILTDWSGLLFQMKMYWR